MATGLRGGPMNGPLCGATSDKGRIVNGSATARDTRASQSAMGLAAPPTSTVPTAINGRLKTEPILRRAAWLRLGRIPVRYLANPSFGTATATADLAAAKHGVHRKRTYNNSVQCCCISLTLTHANMLPERNLSRPPRFDLGAWYYLMTER